MLRSKVGKALDRHILRNWISIYKIVLSVHIKNQYIYKISCPCLRILISRIWIILTHPWAALERHQWVLFNAFLIAATGSVLPKPNLLAHPHLKLVRKPCYATLSKPRSFSLISCPPAQLHWHENCMGQPYLSCPTATPRGEPRVSGRLWSLSGSRKREVWKPQEDDQWFSSRKRRKGSLEQSCWLNLRTLETLQCSQHHDENWKCFKCWQYTGHVVPFTQCKVVLDNTARQSLNTCFLFLSSFRHPCHWMLVLLSQEEQILFPSLFQCVSNSKMPILSGVCGKRLWWGE